MPSYIKLLNEYLSESEHASLQTDHIDNVQNRVVELSIEDKNKVINEFFQFTLLTLLHQLFGVFPLDVIPIGGGTQGAVLGLETTRAVEGFHALSRITHRIRGPFGNVSPTKMAVKVQIITNHSAYSEKRMLREE
jgi:hypothetical protein